MARKPAVSAKIRRACGLPERGPLPTNFRVRVQNPYALYRAARDADNVELLRIMGDRATNERVRNRAATYVRRGLWGPVLGGAPCDVGVVRRGSREAAPSPAAILLRSLHPENTRRVISAIEAGLGPPGSCRQGPASRWKLDRAVKSEAGGLQVTIESQVTT